MSEGRRVDEGTGRRNTSPYEWFLAEARRHRPAYAFGGDFDGWSRTALAAVLGTLGRLPDPVDPKPELIAACEVGSVRQERWVLDVADGLAVVANLNRPAETPPPGGLPGILCWHGHTPGGKQDVMAIGAAAEAVGNESSYGRRMAEAGFVTFAIDWMGRGDLDDRRKPNHRPLAGQRDWCNLYYLHATMLGMTPLGINLSHGKALVDFLSGQSYLDAGRLGVMGLSGGGTMTLWSALFDERLKAAEIICYSDLFADFAYRDLNYCGSQITPGLFELVDLPDLQGLLAPKPLLVDIGFYDDCFLVDSAMACHNRVRAIYAAAGAEKNIELDLAATGHAWAGQKSVEFFTHHLRRGDEGRESLLLTNL